MIDRRTFLVSLPLVLAGCATRSSVTDGTVLRSNQGILALRLSSNSLGRISFVPYGPSRNVDKVAENFFGANETLALKEGQDIFLVLPVDAGEYMWSKVELGGGYSWLSGSTRFRIKPGQITYIGNISIFAATISLSIKVTDKEDEMKEHLRANFPQYDKSLSFEKSLAELSARKGK